MSVIAIVGAGPGLGLSIAKVFGRRGFDVALIARSQDKLDDLAATLAHEGIDAQGFAADVADSGRLVAALTAAAQRFGPIDVLEFSPYAGLEMSAPKDVTVDNLRPHIDNLLYGAVDAVRTVLPAMLSAGRGTLLFTTGGGAIDPYPMLATANIAQAGQRNWAINLHNTLADDGIYAANVAINLLIGTDAPDGYPFRAPDDIAVDYWQLHLDRDKAEHSIP